MGIDVRGQPGVVLDVEPRPNKSPRALCALEARLRVHLRGRFGPNWFASAEAGALLRDMWRHGQRLRADELLAELTGEELEFAVLLGDLALD